MISTKERYPAEKVTVAVEKLRALKQTHPTWINPAGYLDVPKAPKGDMVWRDAVGARELRPVLKRKGEELVGPKLTKACTDELRQIKSDAKSADKAKQTMAQTQLAAWLQTGIAERKENDRHTAEWSEMLTPLKVPKRAKRRPPGAGLDPIRRARR